MHVVHIKAPYGSLAEAEHDTAGIALLAFLFEVISVGHARVNQKRKDGSACDDDTIPDYFRAGSG